jgi:hypothetical protein
MTCIDYIQIDRLYGLVIRVLGYRSGGPGSIPGSTRKKVGLERGPLSLVSKTEELLDGKVAAPVSKTENTAVGIRHTDHVAPSIRNKLAITSPTSGGRSVGIVRSQTQTMEFSLVYIQITCVTHRSTTNQACNESYINGKFNFLDNLNRERK